MAQGQAQRPRSFGQGAGRVAVGIATCLIVACILLMLRVNFGGTDLAVAVVAGVAVGTVAAWFRSAPRPPSTRVGTTRSMFVLAALCGLGGPVAGLALVIHTSAPGCDGWVGCGTNHSLVGVGVLCIIVGLLLAAVFAALGLIARSVGEMQAASMAHSTGRQPVLLV